VTPLPKDHAQGPNTYGSTSVVHFAFDAGFTQQLLQEPARAFRLGPHEVLLAALWKALGRWSGMGSHWVHVEGHGRTGAHELDLSRSIGWFTRFTPVQLQGDVNEPFDLTQFRATSENEAEVRVHPFPEVSFNYLGQEGLLDERSLLYAGQPVWETFEMASPRQVRPYVLDVGGGIRSGRLEMILRFSKNLHGQTSVERLSKDIQTSLRELVSQCASAESQAAAPSDFPLAGLDQEALNKILRGDA
jgi:non-ribosomal peptide synthase protein (TIGR01720 family)